MSGTPTDARAWLDHVLEPGWTRLFDEVTGADPLRFPGYPEQVDAARAKTGASEAVLVADGTIRGGPRAVALAFEFGFLGGSMGEAAGERIARAFEHAAGAGLAVVAMTASGGARMQEGMRSLAQMPATVAARRAFASTGRPFVAYLRNPTTGGVFASFASLADLVWAEPGATIGFAGPRVAEALGDEPLPAGSHTAEAARDAGLVDEVLGADDVPAALASVMAATGSFPPVARPDEPAGRIDPAVVAAEAWDAARTPRDPLPAGRPLRRSGPGITCRLAAVGPGTVVAITMAGGPVGPAAYRDARHAIALAERLRLPVVTVIDTPGADPRAPSEAGGIAREIALTFDAMLGASVPTVALVTGAGSSGGALALAACDRVLIGERAAFSVIAPQGAAAILRRDDIAGVAADLHLTAADLRSLGLADLVVAQPSDPEGARTSAHAAVSWALGDIADPPTPERTDRWRMR